MIIKYGQLQSPVLQSEGIKLNKAVGSFVPTFITADLALDTAALVTALHLDTTIECNCYLLHTDIVERKSHRSCETAKKLCLQKFTKCAFQLP